MDGPAEYPGQAPDEAEVCHVALHWGGEAGLPVAGHHSVHDTFQGGIGGAKKVKSHRMAWRAEQCIGRTRSRVDREAAHVCTVSQLRPALRPFVIHIVSGSAGAKPEEERLLFHVITSYHV